MTRLAALIFGALLLAPSASASRGSEEGESANSAADMARLLQNPLANIRALMTDNSVGFDTGTDGGTSYGFQIQPVYAVDLPEWGFTFLPRAVIPIVGLEPGTDVPPVGTPTPPGSDRLWGLSDSVVQLFFAPHTEHSWKWGIGPQFSFATHTNPGLKGPNWGAGVTGVITGGIGESLSIAAIVGNIWSFDGDFNSFVLHPMIYYNIAAVPGLAIAYNAPISADWKEASRNRWTVPLGLSLSKTFDVGGHGIDVGAGPYYNVVRPDGGARWQLRFSISWMLP